MSINAGGTCSTLCVVSSRADATCGDLVKDDVVNLWGFGVSCLTCQSLIALLECNVT